MDPLAQVSDWPVGRVAVAVVGPGGVLASTGATGPGDEFAWASVTKLVTALAALDAVAEGALGLEEAAGPPGSTVRHLLAHASGLAPEQQQSLAAPGRARIYSNAGFEVLAAHVEARTGDPFPQRWRSQVTEELGMSGARLDGSPAYAGRGTIGDLCALAGELLRPTLLPADLFAEATAPVFPDLAGVLPGFGRQTPNPWGLGLEIRGTKSPHWTGAGNSPRTFGHFGRTGSFLWVDPDADLACAGLADRDFGPWAASAWPALSDAVLAAYAGS